MELFWQIKRFFIPCDKFLLNEIKRHGLIEVSVFGIGDIGKALIDLLVKNKIQLKFFYDSSLTTGEHQIMGCPILSVDDLPNEKSQAIVIASEVFVEDMIHICRQKGYTGKIICIKQLL